MRNTEGSCRGRGKVVSQELERRQKMLCIESGRQMDKVVQKNSLGSSQITLKETLDRNTDRRDRLFDVKID